MNESVTLLTKRELFTALALIGITANNSPEIIKLESEIKAEMALLIADYALHALNIK
jgi:hypothetical protein